MRFWFVTAVLTLFLGCDVVRNQDLTNIQLPDGFRIEKYAEGIETARAMSFGSDGTLFVGSKSGEVTAVLPDKSKKVLMTGLQSPVGVDFHNGNLYFSEISQISVIRDILSNLDNPQREILIDDLPTDTWHGWKFIAVGPDDHLYIPVGAPCNVCYHPNTVYASILKYDLEGNFISKVADGVRNTVGFDWHPFTAELWFTDNGRDWLGDELPKDELNRLVTPGQHFGFPFVHGPDFNDPEFYEQRPDGFTFRQPEVGLPAHVAALGMRFYTAGMFPEKYRGGIFIAEHGSWNRSTKIGYRVTFVPLDGSTATGYEIFASGWEVDEDISGRPADVEIGPDGALYVSDDYANAIYRITF
jgi:glucose/arabinose dehydrogenase